MRLVTRTRAIEGQMQYTVTTAKEFVEAFAKCQPGDMLTIVFSDALDIALFTADDEDDLDDFVSVGQA